MQVHIRRVMTASLIIFAIVLFFAILSPFIMSPTNVGKAFASAGVLAPILFILLVIIAPTPGTVIGISGLSYFSVYEVAIYLYIGYLAGVSIVFLLVQRYGRPMAQRFIKEEKLQHYDALIKRHGFLQWLVYTIPIMPVELITLPIALSGKRFRDFFVSVALALPIYVVLITAIGYSLYVLLAPVIKYTSIVIILLFSYGVLHALYAWKREEIHDHSRRISKSISEGMGLGKGPSNKKR